MTKTVLWYKLKFLCITLQRSSHLLTTNFTGSNASPGETLDFTDVNISDIKLYVAHIPHNNHIVHISFCVCSRFSI
jgi:hypothetical protein